ncbi:hypothetical protein AAVH_29893 [Aphelenchoides avenae]|nr:hypothetical protein AAVH_29893 [Aphelenchus avenae]
MALTNQTKEMHKEINRALLALAAAPLFTLIGPVWFFLFCIATQASPGPISAFMACSLTLITIANPLTTLYFVKPYRYALMSYVGWKKPVVAPAETIATGVLSRATHSTYG